MALSATAQTQLVLGLTLGMIFLVSALAKLRNPAAFVQGVLEYQVLPRRVAQVYGWLLPFFEFVTALLLFSGKFLFVAASLAVLMLTSFAMAIALAALQGRQAICNCFGATHRGTPIGLRTLLRDVLLLVPTTWLLITAATSRTSAVAWPRDDPVVLTVLFILAVLIALTYLLIAAGPGLLTGALGAAWRRDGSP